MNYLQLKLESKDYPVMREIVLPGEGTLALLHQAIQATFRWLDYHLYEFTDAKGARYAEALDDGNDDMDAPPVDATTVTLDKVFKKAGTKLDYMYDFGDGNEVEVTFMKKVKPPFLPLFATEGPYMIEDSRGVGGEKGVWSILKNPKGKDYEEIVSWLWGAFHLTPEQALYHPTASDIYGKIFKLVKLLGTGTPSSPLADAWKEYVVEK